MEEDSKLKDLEAKVSNFPDRATFISVHSQATLDRANEFLHTIKAFQKQLDDFFDENIKRLHKAHKEAKAQKSQFEEPLKRAEGIVKAVITKYLVEQDDLRTKAKEELEQDAEKRFEKAREIERLGDKKKAEEIRKEETSVAAALPPPVKTAGTSLTKYWTWEEEDLEKVPRKWWILDRLGINKEVREKKGKTNIPGIRVFQKASSKTRIK